MKRFDFSKRHNISAICFIAIMIVTFVLCYSLPVVHADDPKISDYYFIKDILKLSDAITHNGETGYYNVDGNIFNEPTFLSNDSMNYYDQLESIWNCDFPYGIGSNYNMTIYVSTNDEVKVLFDGQSLNLNYDSNYNYLTPPSVYGGSPCTFTYSNGSLTNQSWLSGGSYKNISDCDYILYSTAPINMYYQNADRNLNYLLIEGNVGKGSGGFDVTPSYPDESADNNLVFAQSDFIFTHQTYYAPYSSSINTGSSVPVGTISFKGQPNNYQLEHPEEFTLQIRFVFEYDVDYKNQTGSEVSYFKKTSTLLNNEKNLRINFGNSQPYFIPLTTFIQNKNNADFVIKDVFDNLLSDGNSLTGLLAQSKEITSLRYNKFLITCYANIIANNQTSGGYIENYNFNSRMGATTTNNIETNPNPYTPKPSDQASDDPDTSNITPKPNVPGPGGSDDTTSPSTNTTTTTSNGGSQIVITNSPTFNNNSSASSNATSNGNGGGMIPTLLSYLSNGQQSSVSTMQNVADTNGWLNVVNSTYTFVPVSVWNSLIFYFGIALSILIVGFIISVVIKFIT